MVQLEHSFQFESYAASFRGDRQVGLYRLAGEPGIHNPGGDMVHLHRNGMAGGYGFRAPLAEPVLGRRVAPIRVLEAPE
jgi:hypothetical protein